MFFLRHQDKLSNTLVDDSVLIKNSTGGCVDMCAGVENSLKIDSSIVSAVKKMTPRVRLRALFFAGAIATEIR
jgi:hypothetical protein